MIVGWWAAAAVAGVESDVARGWYLWRTGQDQAAVQVATAAVAAAPDDLGARQLEVAMSVVAGAGPSLEARTREWWAEAPKDPTRRVGLALVLAQRHAAPGPWCDEVTVLVTPVTEGAPHYWATVADRLRELRCVGSTDHADAEMRRLAKEPGLGWADGVLARAEAGYLKEDLPDDLERLWAEQPHRLDRAGALWADNVAGPGRAAARRVTARALDLAVASDDPVAVFAALTAWRAAGEDKKALAAAERLRALDPAADPDRTRSVEDVHDPEIFSQIDGCVRSLAPVQALACLDALTVAPAGPEASWFHAQRRSVLEALRRPDDAYAEARAAWQAEPDHRFNARVFARLAVERRADPALAADAAAVVLAGRVPEVPGDVPAEKRPALAKDLDLGARALRLAGRPAEALAHQSVALALAPTAERQLLLGLLLGESGAVDEGVLQLAWGLGAATDTALVSEARDALGKWASTWMPGGVRVLLDEASRPAGEDRPVVHPLVGRPFPAGWLPTLPEGEARSWSVAVLWGSRSEASVASLERVANLGTRYAEKGVRVVALDIDATPVPAPEGVVIEVRPVGPSAMRSLMAVVLPTVVLVEPKGKVAAVLAPYDRGSLALEQALDERLPK